MLVAVLSGAAAAAAASPAAYDAVDAESLRFWDQFRPDRVVVDTIGFEADMQSARVEVTRRCTDWIAGRRDAYQLNVTGPWRQLRWTSGRVLRSARDYTGDCPALGEYFADLCTARLGHDMITMRSRLLSQEYGVPRCSIQRLGHVDPRFVFDHLVSLVLTISNATMYDRCTDHPLPFRGPFV